MKGIKVFVITGILLLAVGVIGIMFTFNNEPERILEEKQIPDEGFNTIDVNADNVKVEITATDDKAPKAVLTGKQLKGNKIKYEVAAADGQLQIQLQEQQKKLYSFDFRSTGLTLKVYIPEKQYDSLHIANGDGEIHMNHLKVKEIDASTTDGRMEMKDIEGSKLTAEAEDGKILADHMQVDDVKMTAKDGKLKLTQVESTIIKTDIEDGKIVMDNVDGEIIGKASDGSIFLVTEDLVRPIALEVGDGNITIKTRKKPENVDFDVHVDDGIVDILGKYKESTVIGDGDHPVKLTVNDGLIVVK